MLPKGVKSLKTIEKIVSGKSAAPQRKRVAAYARVSIESVRMQHSLSAQVSYYSSFIQSRRDWIFAGVYADYAASGTKTDGRGEFKRMLADCEAGQIDMILTKSIQRFARNTVDLLKTVRRLRELGIAVVFEKENIHSLSGDGEMMLTILASFAQEESRSISDNCKWGVRKRFQTGESGVCNKHILGYRYDGERKQYVVIPEEAVVIQRMFRLYLDGKSLKAICADLNGRGYRTVNGCLFQEASLSQLIKNEIYAGDLLRQKTFIADPIIKNKVKNNGELPKYYHADAHEAILDRETYARVRAEITRRASLLNPVYPFTGKKKQDNGVPHVHWICRSKKETGKTCRSRNYPEALLERICAGILRTDGFNADAFSARVKEMIALPDGSIEFHLTGNETRVWRDLHLDEFRHETTKTDAFQRRIRCGLCGETYHQVCRNGKWVSWYCMGKRLKGHSCSGRDYPDSHLRIIAAIVMETETFNEALFSQQVEQIVILDNYKFEFIFKDGRRKRWEKA